jgi:hypothetical protein
MSDSFRLGTFARLAFTEIAHLSFGVASADGTGCDTLAGAAGTAAVVVLVVAVGPATFTATVAGTADGTGTVKAAGDSGTLKSTGSYVCVPKEEEQ